jgi:hypothetical protein
MTKTNIYGRRIGPVGLAAMVAALALVPPPPPADAVTVLAGACALNVTLTSPSGTVPKELGQWYWEVGGSGTCVSVPPSDLPGDPTIPDGIPGETLAYLWGLPNQVITTGSLTGGLRGLAPGLAGCALGVLEGTLEFDPGAPGFGSVTSDLAIGVVAGAALTVGLKKATQFVGAGAFTQLTTDQTLACATTGSAGTTVTGVFVFGDPALS